MAIKSDFIKAVYDVTQLNQLTGCFISGGVIGGGDLKVTYKKGIAVVGEGRCILPDKAVLTVDRGGYKIPDEIYEGYIYIQNGKIQWGDMPDSGDIFLLAHITQGKCNDTRKHAYIIKEAGEVIEL